VNAIAIRRITAAGLALAMLGAAGCGQYVRDQGRAPAQVVIQNLEAASGADPSKFAGVLYSDVVTNVKKTVNGQQVDVPTIFADNGRVSMTLILKDQTGTSTSPSALNQITFSRYHVNYRRADGRNTPGVDVPFPFDGAATFTVPASSGATGVFELVRHDAKQEAPLLALANSPTIIDTLTEVTFYGRDQAGNDVTATGSIQIEFGNFGDPQ
jgi:hypothetical protein